MFLYYLACGLVWGFVCVNATILETKQMEGTMELIQKRPNMNDIVVHRCRLSPNYNVTLGKNVVFGTKEKCIAAANKFTEKTKITVLLEKGGHYEVVSYYELGFRQFNDDSWGNNW
jgi:hypothetical protein